MFIDAEVRSYDAGIVRHEHPFAQIIVPIDGVMEIEIGGRGDRLTTGVFAALDVATIHDFQAPRNTHFLIIDVDEEALAGNNALALGLPFRRRVRPLDPRALRFLRYYARELQDSALPDLARRQLALAGLTLLAGGEPSAAPHRHAHRMADAARWIADHATAGQPMGNVATRFALSRSHFRELFRRELGRSPKQHEIDARLARAVELLLCSEKSVSEIAFAVGYANVSSFTRTFTRRYGATPGQFRAGQGRNGEK
jgi:AraC-like DNA-binding protein